MTYWEQQALNLECFPAVAEHVARPWDNADEYVLKQLDTRLPTLVINDRYGALVCSLQQPLALLESACARLATSANLVRNQKSEDLCFWAEQPEQLPSTPVQVIIRIPKNLDQLKYWLENCRQQLPAETRYFLAGMAKHIPVSWLKWLEAHSDSYQQYPIERKARVMELRGLRPDPSLKTVCGYSFTDEGRELELNALPGVFSRNSLDIGSRFLLEQIALANRDLDGTICDLGCGNGLLGISMAIRYPNAQVLLTDDSLVAAESARLNIASHKISNAVVFHGHILDAIDEPVDYILCNPPFHDGHKQLADIAEDMFRASALKLKKSGELLVIANRHLPYKPMLKQFFRDARVMAENPKFMLYRCRRPI